MSRVLDGGGSYFNLRSYISRTVPDTYKMYYTDPPYVGVGLSDEPILAQLRYQRVQLFREHFFIKTKGSLPHLHIWGQKIDIKVMACNFSIWVPQPHTRILEHLRR